MDLPRPDTDFLTAPIALVNCFVDAVIATASVPNLANFNNLLQTIYKVNILNIFFGTAKRRENRNNCLYPDLPCNICSSCPAKRPGPDCDNVFRI
jgi:hypothetical protein